MVTLIEDKYDAVWSLLGSPEKKTSQDRWKWCFSVAASIKKLGPERQTIEGICVQLARDKGSPVNFRGPTNMTEAQLMEVHLAIFAVICWISASIKPVLKRERSTTPQSPQISLGLPQAWVEHSDYAVPHTDLKRPATKMFTGIRDHGSDLGTVPQDPILESILTFASLHRIGHVNLKLVDCLTDHLHFDARRRTLSIFRFPSFCVMKIMRTDALLIIDK